MKPILVLATILALGPSVSGRQVSNSPFANLSERAGHVVLVALREAQQRGADTIDVNDLVVALVIEDQEPDAPGLFESPPGALFLPGAVPSVSAHKPFFSPKVAIDVLVKMNEVLPRSKSLPHGTEMHTSAAYDRVMDVAKDLPSQFHQSEVQVNVGTPNRPIGMYQAVVPLDLLAAALREPCGATKMLQEAGITEEKVLQTIRAGGDLESGSSSRTP